MFFLKNRLKIASLRIGKHRIVKNIASLRKVNIAHPYMVADMEDGGGHVGRHGGRQGGRHGSKHDGRQVKTISQFLPDFTIFTRFHSFDQISKFLSDITIFSRFHNFH